MAELRKELAVTKARGGVIRTKANLIRTTSLSQADLLFTNKIWDFCTEYLFTRVKFLPKGWKVYDPNNNTNFAALVKEHIPMASNVCFEDEWQRIIIDAIIRKYTDMRCNVNNHIRDTFKSEYSNCYIIII